MNSRLSPIEDAAASLLSTLGTNEVDRSVIAEKVRANCCDPRCYPGRRYPDNSQKTRRTLQYQHEIGHDVCGP